jgi:hypothetical protein
MPVSPYAGKPAEPSMLIDVPQLVTAYYSEAHLRRILEDAQALIANALAAAARLRAGGGSA